MLERRKVREVKKILSGKTVVHAIDIYCLCSAHGRAEWYPQIYNRIMREDMGGMEHDLIIIDRKGRLNLQSDGIIYFIDILDGYFDRTALLDTARHLRLMKRQEAIDKITRLAEIAAAMTPTEREKALKCAAALSRKAKNKAAPVNSSFLNDEELAILNKIRTEIQKSNARG